MRPRPAFWGLVCLAASGVAHAGPTEPAPASPAVLRLFADVDDDNDDGVADKDDPSPALARDLTWVLPQAGEAMLVVHGVRGPAVRAVVGEKSVTASTFTTPLGSAKVGLEGLSAGRASIDFAGTVRDVAVCELRALDAGGRVVDLATSHASISRTLPKDLAMDLDGSTDQDALSWLAVCPRGFIPTKLAFRSERPGGAPLDEIPALAIAAIPCPHDTGADFECAVTPQIRAVVDLVDRSHPAAAERSLLAEVGGRIEVLSGQTKAASIRVGGPRETTAGPIDRYRAELVFHVVRASPGGQVPVGINDAGAQSVARAEAHAASMIWGQCGIHFGPDEAIKIELVDPPPRHLVAIGCESGLPASGGEVSFLADGKPVRVATHPGDAPMTVARAVARAVDATGLRARVSPNARVAFGAARTADVLVRRADGALVDVTPLGEAPPSTDATLSVCIGEVDLADGLLHFDDLDAIAGTLEERTLIKAYQDDDPTTIDVFVVPSFSKTGRIGESFIDSDGSGIQNVAIVDRTGIRAGARSYALPHELGHMLLDMPGHPDDFGVDRPWMLMDADATDASIFGPRRLSIADCERAIRESGPGATVPLLKPWPLFQRKAKAR